MHSNRNSIRVDDTDGAVAARGRGRRAPADHGITPPMGPTTERVEAALAELRRTGLYDRAAEAAGVSAMTFLRWRKADPKLQERCDAEINQVNVRIGQKYRLAAEMHVETVLRGGAERTVRQEAVKTRAGVEVVTLTEERPVRLDTHLAKLALGKLDPAWTHPKQHVEMSGEVTLSEAVAAAHRALEAHAAEDALEGPDEGAPAAPGTV